MLKKVAMATKLIALQITAKPTTMFSIHSLRGAKRFMVSLSATAVAIAKTDKRQMAAGGDKAFATGAKLITATTATTRITAVAKRTTKGLLNFTVCFLLVFLVFCYR